MACHHRGYPRLCRVPEKSRIDCERKTVIVFSGKVLIVVTVDMCGWKNAPGQAPGIDRKSPFLFYAIATG